VLSRCGERDALDTGNAIGERGATAAICALTAAAIAATSDALGATIDAVELLSRRVCGVDQRTAIGVVRRRRSRIDLGFESALCAFCDNSYISPSIYFQILTAIESVYAHCTEQFT